MARHWNSRPMRVPSVDSLDVTICIVNHNTEELLRNCLRSVLEHTKQASFEIVAVDNASSDGSVDMVQAEFPSVRLVRNRRNIGFVAANNQAIRASSSRYVFLLNSDTLLLSGIVDAMVQFADEHPDAGAIGCPQLKPDLTLHQTSYASPSLWLLAGHFLALRRVARSMILSRVLALLAGPVGARNVDSYLANATRPEVPMEVDVLSGACLLFRRDVIATIGYPDDRFLHGPDDWDWCMRIKSGGWRNYLLPCLGLVHFVGSSTKAVGVEADFQFYRGWFYFCRKHWGRKADVFLGVVIVPLLIVKLVQSVALGYLLGGRSRATLEREWWLWARLLQLAVLGGGRSNSYSGDLAENA